MYVNPLFDPSKLSDDEITKTISDLNKRAMIAHSSIRNPLVLEQLNSMIDALNEERIMRMNKQAAEAFQAMFPAVIESDPDFKTEKAETTEDHRVRQVVPAPQAAKKFDNIPDFHKEYIKRPTVPTPPKPTDAPKAE